MVGHIFLAYQSTAIQALQLPPLHKEPLHSHERQKSWYGPAFTKQLNQHRSSSEPFNNLILTFCNHGHLDQALDALSVYDSSTSPIPHSTYISILKACNRKKSLYHVQRIHSHLAQHDVSLVGSLGDYLVVALAKCGGLEDACLIHSGLRSRTVYSWTAIISAYVEFGQGQEALRLYHCMRDDGVEPDSFTFVSLFRACGSIPDLVQGRKLHVDARRKGYDRDLFVGASLVTMYGICGSLVEAENAFCGLPSRDVVCWSAMLSAYVEQGEGEKALLVYRQMQQEGASPDVQVFASALQACESFGEVEEGTSKRRALEVVQALHADARKKGYSLNPFVTTALVTMYEKFGTIEEAENVFMDLSKSNTATWTVMLSAYLKNNQAERCLRLYQQMIREGVCPDEQTFAVILQACYIFSKDQSVPDADIISMNIARAVHRDLHFKGLSSNVVIGTVLISMYGKYGSMSEVEDAFYGLSQCDIMAWNALLLAYAEQGEEEKALSLYEKIKRQTLPVSEVTLLCILQTCSGTGRLGTCNELHFTIVSAGLDQNLSLANTLIHTYGSCASMADAQAVFDSLESSDAVSWTACIAGYAVVGNRAVCLETFNRMLLADMKPDAVTFASLLSACSHDGLVAKGIEYFDYMRIDCGLAPGLQHYSIMVDLLGRAGDFVRLESILQGMNMQPDLGFWLCLLGASRTHNELNIGSIAFNGAMALQPREGAAFILMSNIICNAGLWRCVDALEDLGLECL